MKLQYYKNISKFQEMSQRRKIRDPFEVLRKWRSRSPIEVKYFIRFLAFGISTPRNRKMSPVPKRGRNGEFTLR